MSRPGRFQATTYLGGGDRHDDRVRHGLRHPGAGSGYGIRAEGSIRHGVGVSGVVIGGFADPHGSVAAQSRAIHRYAAGCWRKVSAPAGTADHGAARIAAQLVLRHRAGGLRDEELVYDQVRAGAGDTLRTLWTWQARRSRITLQTLYCHWRASLAAGTSRAPDL